MIGTAILAENLSDQVASYCSQADLRETVAALLEQRDDIVARWQHRVAKEPFHLGRQGRAVADHIPALVDSLIESLASDAGPDEPTASPITREKVQETVTRHAAMRASQGLSATEVVTELRILRQEICEALRRTLSDEARTRDLLAAVLALGDALDGAITVAVGAVSESALNETAQFVSLAAHDLKTPLAAVKGFAQLAERALRQNKVDPSITAEQFKQMHGAVERMRALIDDVMALAQMSGAVELTLTRATLPDLINEVVALLGNEARERVKVELGPGADRPGRWDVGHLRRAFENLISNALKYAPEDDVVVTIELRRSDYQVRVADKGIGLSRSDREKLFARFYRAPEAIRHKIEGTGLGLFISRAMIQAHGGSLELQSPGPGKGTTAIVTLPRTVKSERALSSQRRPGRAED
ncbi:MAG TPA: sensor histidine kinase [Chloroflexota bacterium]|nr:sensor histidine kinase [Chloroflexota bacterium]